MVQVILTEEQVRAVQRALVEPLQLCDPHGKVLRTIEPEYTKEWIAELKRRAASPGPWYTGQQVQNRLRALQEEWDRTGAFGKVYLHEFLARLDAADPGHMRRKEEAA